jgi:hypothetical protein
MATSTGIRSHTIFCALYQARDNRFLLGKVRSGIANIGCCGSASRNSRSSPNTFAFIGATSAAMLMYAYSSGFDTTLKCPIDSSFRNISSSLSLRRLQPQTQRFDLVRPSNRALCDSLVDESPTPGNKAAKFHFSEVNDPELDSDISGYSEAERFYECVTYHRSLLHDYDRRWGVGSLSPLSVDMTSNSDEHINLKRVSNASDEWNLYTQAVTTSRWPRNVPCCHEVSAMECDLVFCERSPEYRKDIRVCQSTKFRIAAYYASLQNGDQNSRRENGFRVIKELAEQGYPDAMCYYGTYPLVSSLIKSFIIR